MFVCNFSEMFVMLSSVGTRTFHSVSAARLNTDKRKAEAGVSVGSCMWESCGWGCEPAGRRRCRCVRAPSCTWGLRCFRCTTAPTRPERPAQTEPLRRDPPVRRYCFICTCLWHFVFVILESLITISYQYTPVSLQSPSPWSPMGRRLLSAEQFHPVNPSAQRRPEPVYSGRGHHTEPSGDCGKEGGKWRRGRHTEAWYKHQHI